MNLSKANPLALIGSEVAVLAVPWVAFLTKQSHQSVTHTYTVGVLIGVGVGTLVVLWLSVGIVRTAKEPTRRPEVTLITVATLVFLVLYVIVFFAWVYWDIGTLTNFGQRLTHIDAIYVSVGTLSTAGTGSISAVSKLARGVQSAQMTIDMVLAVFVAGVVVTRFVAGRQKPRASE
jgi:hypothetical protein